MLCVDGAVPARASTVHFLGLVFGECEWVFATISLGWRACVPGYPLGAHGCGWTLPVHAASVCVCVASLFN